MSVRVCRCFLWGVLSLILSVGSGYGQTPADDLQLTVLTRYFRANGGDGKQRSISSLRLTGHVTLGNEAARVPFRLLKRRPELMRFEIGVRGEDTWVTAMNRDYVWEGRRKGDLWVEKQVVNDAVRELFLRTDSEFDSPLWTLRSRQRSVDVEIDPANRDLYLLKVRPRNVSARAVEFEIRLRVEDCIEVERIIRLEGQPEVVIRYSDHRVIDDVPVPFKIETRADGLLQSTVEIDEARFNVGTLKVYFDLPK